MNRRTVLIGGAALAGVGVGTYFYGRRILEWTRQIASPGNSGGSLDKINNIVVLMLENRSFDNLLGKLYPKSPNFDGLSGAESNPDLDGRPVPVRNIPGTGQLSITNPWPDPGELWSDINEQVYGNQAPSADQPATMNGFVTNFLHQRGVTADQYVDLSRRVMHFYEPEQVPVISQLAKAFAVSDRWFASAPCQTWPNRFFMHTGTAGGFENNEPYHFLDRETIFERIARKLQPNAFAIYYHDYAIALNLPRLWQYPLNFFGFDAFLEDARNGHLPAYAFIEPQYLPSSNLPNDQHPPHGVTSGEQLIATVYNALRQSPQWTSTLLIITYDEHGGCFDHVTPPKAIPPDDVPSTPFNFDRYGVRVPAVIISPWIKAGSILRPPVGGPPFDHTSIIATLRKRFDLGAALTRRDASAPDLSSLPTAWLSEPTNLGPERVTALQEEDLSARLDAARNAPANDLQQSIVHIHANLPSPVTTVPEHVIRMKRLGAAAPAPSIATMTAGEAAERVRPLPQRLKEIKAN